MQFLGGSQKKLILRGKLPKKAWAVCRFKSGLVKRGGGVFEGGGVDTLMHTVVT